MAESEKFKVGDTVGLKAGGPLMRVTSCTSNIDGYPVVSTIWFEKNGKERSETYLEAVLKADDDEPQ